jgi:hypothetical protein
MKVRESADNAAADSAASQPIMSLVALPASTESQSQMIGVFANDIVLFFKLIYFYMIFCNCATISAEPAFEVQPASDISESQSQIIGAL